MTCGSFPSAKKTANSPGAKQRGRHASRVASRAPSVGSTAAQSTGDVQSGVTVVMLRVESIWVTVESDRGVLWDVLETASSWTLTLLLAADIGCARSPCLHSASANVVPVALAVLARGAANASRGQLLTGRVWLPPHSLSSPTESVSFRVETELRPHLSTASTHFVHMLVPSPVAKELAGHLCGDGRRVPSMFTLEGGRGWLVGSCD